jgi:hypothetical protein
VLFLATSAQASADSLPKEFLGKYCGSESLYLPDENNRCFDTKGEMIGSEALEIKPNEFVGWEFSCDFDSIKVKWDPKISVATKTPLGTDVAHIVASCGGEGYEWKERVKIYFAKGNLHLERRVKWETNFRRCQIEKYSNDDDQVITPEDVPDIMHALKELKKCAAFWQCVDDREQGKVKHCYENDRRWR